MGSGTDDRRQVAEQILMQLGGREFLLMTGCKKLVYDESSLRMHLARNCSGANILKITLGSDDLYEVVFSYHRAPGYKIKDGKVFERPEINRDVARYEGVYDTMLRPIFSEVTGMDTHMPRIEGFNTPVR